MVNKFDKEYNLIESVVIDFEKYMKCVQMYIEGNKNKAPKD